MKKILRNLIEEDIEKILDNGEINKKNFFFLFLHYLLENDRIDLVLVDEIADEFSNEYESFLNDFELELIESNGEIIDILKLALPKFNKRIGHVLDKIEMIKENGKSKHNFN